MNSKVELASLSLSQRFFLAGHVTASIGVLFIMVGSTIRLLETGELSAWPPSHFPTDHSVFDPAKAVDSLRGRFT